MIQIVLEAMTAFKNCYDLSRFIKKAFKGRNGTPAASDSKASKLDCIIKLQSGQFKTETSRSDNHEITMKALRAITTFPKVREYFQLDIGGNIGERLLIKLLTHSVPASIANGFRVGLATQGHGELDRVLLYDILSYLNHSCSPNLINVIDGNVMTCITSQKIQPGDQMFIAYRLFGRETREKRQRELSSWDFVCQCVRCEYHREIKYTEYKRANKMGRKEIEGKLNRPYDWTPQKGAYIIRYRRLISH